MATTTLPYRFRVRRGPTASVATDVALSGELLLNTTTNVLRVGDGATPGGVALSTSGGGGGSMPTSDLLVFDWMTRVAGGCGTLTGASQTLAENLMTAIRAAGVLPKLIWLQPFLGADLAAASIPLIDRLRRTPKLNGFAPANFSESTGLAGDGTAKWIDTKIQPDELGLNMCGGLGAWILTAPTDATHPFAIGTYDTAFSNRFALQTTNAAKIMYWGFPGNGATLSTASAAGHYYGQRSSATSRALYYGGTSIATNTTSDNATGGMQSIWAMACRDNASRYWLGRVGAFYMTDGTLTAGEITALHTALAAFMTAAGR